MNTLAVNVATFASALLLCSASASYAQNKPDALAAGYPNKPIRIIVGNAPGGGTDTVARLVGQKLSERWRYAIVVENRAGATGLIAMEITAKAAADGYTLFLGGSQLVISTVLKKIPFDIRKAYAPVVQLTSQPYLLTINPSLPVSSVKELLAYAKSRPRTLNYGSSGNGSLAHLGMDLFQSMTGVEMVHVPYKGGGPALTDLISGQIQLLLGTAVSVIPQSKAGKLKVLAATSSQRTQALPDTPTLSESGVAGYELNNAYGLYAPARTPASILQAINSECNAIIATPDFRTRLAAADVEPAAANSPGDYKRAIDRDFAKWEKFFKTPGLALDNYR